MAVLPCPLHQSLEIGPLRLPQLHLFVGPATGVLLTLVDKRFDARFGGDERVFAYTAPPAAKPWIRISPCAKLRVLTGANAKEAGTIEDCEEEGKETLKEEGTSAGWLHSTTLTHYFEVQ